MRTINNTDKTIVEIEQMKIVGKIKNNWRQRNVILYQNDNAGVMGELYMIGVSFDKNTTIVTREPEGMNEKYAMNLWSHEQKVYVRD